MKDGIPNEGQKILCLPFTAYILIRCIPSKKVKDSTKQTNNGQLFSKFLVGVQRLKGPVTLMQAHFSGMCLKRASWRDKVISSSKLKSSLLTACYKRGGVSKPSVPQLWLWHLSQPYLITSVGLEGKGNCSMLLAVPRVITLFVTDPGISCLLLASVKLQQASLLACK